MIHEFVEILNAYRVASERKKQTVLVTIVHVDGTFYRKEGVQMLIDEDFRTTGHLSGGCVEKEIVRQSKLVFSSGLSMMVKYDGRYRLGCNGIVYFLLEKFDLPAAHLIRIESAIKERSPLSIFSIYSKEEISDTRLGSHFQVQGYEKDFVQNIDGFHFFEHQYSMLRRLVICGAKHDAGKLSLLAAFLGWEVIVVTSLDCRSNLSQFPGATQLHKANLEALDLSLICERTAIVLMSHNYARDLKALKRIITSDFEYIGILGSAKRKDQLINDLISIELELEWDALDTIRGPVGLEIESETPEEIALSIMSELTKVFNGGKTTKTV